MTAATQLRGNVSPLTPPPRLVTAVDDDEAEIQLPPLPPPPGEQVTILAFFRQIKQIESISHTFVLNIRLFFKLWIQISCKTEGVTRLLFNLHVPVK